MKRIYIVNPVAGKGKTLDTIEEIKAICNKKQYDHDVIYTTKLYSATDLAKEYSYGDNVIFSVGGDGTLNEVVNGIKEANKISIVPCGSGNDFYRSIKDTTEKIDLGKVNDRYFINIASFGIDANVADIANKLKEKGQTNTYIKAILKAIIEYSSLDTNLGLFTLIAVCNGSYYGNGICMAPFANINDDYLDLCKVDDMNRLKMIRLFLKLMNTHLLY